MSSSVSMKATFCVIYGYVLSRGASSELAQASAEEMSQRGTRTVVSDIDVNTQDKCRLKAAHVKATQGKRVQLTC
ncbi:protein of unknown function [Georgfuchsia toluolica]|uniref:Uncharacterized protein n=1 Tax=Georgfuchsia toluolica TaxID=424218 RepID=A0A916N1Q2_9PROT|nr:protein of unknown function [Georgfuchsia toluolica]